MRDQCAVSVSRLSLILALGLVAACGKRERVDAAPEAATAEPTLSPDNYVPAQTFAVTSYEAPASGLSIDSPLSDQSDLPSGQVYLTDSTQQNLSQLSKYGAAYHEGAGGPLRLVDGKAATFYTGFPLSVKFALKFVGGYGRMTVDFGLIEKAADGAPPELRSTFKACHLGSTEAVYDGTTAADGDLARFKAAFIIPESCLRDGQATRMMLYMALNPDGAVKPASGDLRQLIVLDDQTIEREGLCLKFDKNATECQNALLIDRSPGINVRFIDFVSNDSVGVLPAADPAVSIGEDRRMPRPLVMANGSLALEGLAPDAAELGSYAINMRYDLCAGAGSADTVSDDCDPDVGWQPLNAISDLPPESENVAGVGLETALTALTPGKNMGFSVPLHIVGAVHKLLRKEERGVWGYVQDFRIRACATLTKDGVPVDQFNLDSQAENGNPMKDDCRVFPIVIADERVDALTSCRNGSSSSASFVGSRADCDDAAPGVNLSAGTPHGFAADDSAVGLRGEGQDSFGLLAQSSPDETKFRILKPRAQFSTRWFVAFGSESSLFAYLASFSNLQLTPMSTEFRVESGAGIGGLINVELLEATLSGKFDLSGNDKHFIDPAIRVFGIKIFGTRSDIAGGKLKYEVPIAEIVGTIQLAKSVKKAKKKKVKAAKDDEDKPQIEDDNLGGDKNAIYVKERCEEKRAQFSFVTVMVEACGDIGLYLSVGAEAVIAAPEDDEEQDFPNGKRVARAAIFFVPSVASNAHLEASVGIAIGRVGVGGEVNLIQIGLPITLSAKVGNALTLVEAGTGAGDAAYGMRGSIDFDIDLDLEYLSGRLYVFAALDGPQFCEWWLGYYPCGWGEIVRGELDLFSWEGGTNSYSIYHSNLVSRKWDPYWAQTASHCPAVFGATEVREGEPAQDYQVFNEQRRPILCSSDDKLKLVMKGKGLQIEDSDGNVGWRVEGGRRLVLNADGNLWFGHNEDQKSFESNTHGGQNRLILLNSGNLALVSLESGEVVFKTDAEAPAPPVPGSFKTYVAANSDLEDGERIWDAKKQFSLYWARQKGLCFVDPEEDRPDGRCVFAEAVRMQMKGCSLLASDAHGNEKTLGRPREGKEGEAVEAGPCRLAIVKNPAEPSDARPRPMIVRESDNAVVGFVEL